MQNKREKGSEYERKAAAYLEQQGFQTLSFRFSCRQGEIDLIGIEKDELVFVEVKYRRTSAMGFPEEAVDRIKQERICRCSSLFLLKHPEYRHLQVRYDVVAICGEEYRWYRNAFPYTAGRGKRIW